MKNLRWFWPASLVAIHTAKLFYWFRHVDFSSPYPIVNLDYIIYYSRALRAHAFFERSGRYWGYDPYEMAGYIAGPIHEAGSHFTSLVSAFLAPIISIKTSQLLLVIAGMAAAPFVILAAVRVWEGTWPQAWCGFAISVLMFGVVDNQTGWFLTVGLFGFLMSCFFAIYQVGLFNKFLRASDWKSWALLTLTSSLIIQLHPGSVFIVVVPCIFLYAGRFRKISFNTHLAIFGTAVFVILSNAYWFRSYLAFTDWLQPVGILESLGWRALRTEFNPYHSSIPRVMQILLNFLFLKYAGQAIWNRFNNNTAEGIALAAWVLGLFAIGYFGSHIPIIRDLQPRRYCMAFWILLYCLAGFSLQSGIKNAASLAVMTAGSLALFIYFNYFRDMPPFTNRLPPSQEKLIAFIKNNGPFPGRVLLECGEFNIPTVNEIIPHLTHQPLLGGSNPGNVLITRSTLFKGTYGVSGNTRPIKDKPMAFGKHLAEMDEATLKSYLDLYNVTKVVAYYPLTIQLLNKFDGLLKPLASVGDYQVYSVERQPNWFLTGSGGVSMDYDRIVITEPSQGRLTLKFHWIKTLATIPPLKITAVSQLDDPVPFIEIDNSEGVKRIEVINAGL